MKKIYISLKNFFCYFFYELKKAKCSDNNHLNLLDYQQCPVSSWGKKPYSDQPDGRVYRQV